MKAVTVSALATVKYLLEKSVLPSPEELQPQPEIDSTKRYFRLAAWLTFLFIVLAYANSFRNDFQFDDFHTVNDNPAIRSLSNIPRFFTDATTFSVLPANRTYRPMVSTTLAIDYAMGRGYVPFWFHLSTFLFFLVLVGVLFMLYRRILEQTSDQPAVLWIALATAAWFGLHPAIAETVNYVIQRGDLYCTLGAVAALAVYAALPGLRRTGLYLLPLIFALLSKPPAAVFPVLLFFYVFFFESKPGEARLKKSLIAALPSVAVTAGLMILQSAMTPKTYAPSIISAWDYRLTQPFVWLRYFGALFLPVHLNVDTDLTPFSSFNMQAFAGLLFLALFCVAIYFTARRRTLYPIAYGLIWFVVTQLPTSLYTLSEVENDHRMFFSFVGLMLSVTWTIALLLHNVELPKKRAVITVAAVLTLTGYAFGVHERNKAWRTAESLWYDDVQKSPHNGRGLMIYGLSLMGRGDYANATRYFNDALKYTPNYPTLEINLGVVYGAQRRPEAEQHFLRAISLAPSDDTTHAFYGRWLFEMNRTEEALAQINTAIALNPSRPMQREVLLQVLLRRGDMAAVRQAAVDTLRSMPDDKLALALASQPVVENESNLINLSLSQYQQHQYLESIESAKKALAINPKSAVAYNNIGASYAALQQWRLAAENEEQALRIDPNLTIAKNNLAAYRAAERGSAPPAQSDAQLINESLSLYQVGKYPQSIEVARQALKLNPKSAQAWNNIAAANAAMKKWDEAINAANKAVSLDPNFQLAKNNLAWAVSEKQKLTH